MKTRLLQIWRVSYLAAAIPIIGGCVQSSATDTAKVAAQPTNTPVVATAVAETNPPVAGVSENAPPPDRAEPAPGSEAKPVPADLKLSAKASEIVKLAQAGVSENVMLAFVTNTSATFNLGSDQIVYLNDLGVGSDVITAMIEHDRLLREGGGALPPMLASPAAVAAEAQPAQPDAATIAAAAAPQAIAQPQAAATEAPPAPATTEVVPAPPANVTYNYFYDSLSPYGTWVEVDGYGRCWQPNVVVLQSGWRPYCHGGRWIYSDYGWYWHSDYSWGWAPFHYGRWFSHPRWGWCWRPDTIWGPSWVSWRYTDAYCGWAPLPPAAYYSPGFGFTYYGSSVGVSFGFGLGWDCFSFVSWNHFRDHRPYRYCAPPHEARRIHEHARIVSDIGQGHNGRIINRGIAPDRVSHFTKSEIRPVRVREEAMGGKDRHLVPGDRLDRGGKELVIRRPHLPQTPAPPVAAKTGRDEPRSAQKTSFSERSASLGSPGRGVSARPTPPDRTKTIDAAPRSTPPASFGPRNEPRQATATTDAAARSRSFSAGRPAAEPPKSTATPGAVPTIPPSTTTPARPPARDAEVRSRPTTAAAPAIQSPAPTRPVAPPATPTPAPNNVVTFGRREPSPATTPTSPNRTVTRSPETRTRPNITTTWTQPTRTQPSVAVNNAAPVRTLPSRPTPAPTVQSPTAPLSSRSYTAPTPPPGARSEPRWSAPAPSAPPAMTRPSSPPAYSAPVVRSSPAPAPAPAPSFTPRPAPSAPSAPSAAPAPRSSPPPSPPPSSGGGRSEGGRSRGQR